jgi:hypothetical protein
MRRAEPTPLSAEGPVRAGVRVALCLAGWRWPEADAEAELLTRAALQIVGAKRPSWKEGQPRWTEDGALPIGRTHCKRCARPLPEGQLKFCGPVCAKADRVYADSRYDKEAKAIHDAARWAARREKRAARERS